MTFTASEKARINMTESELTALRSRHSMQVPPEKTALDIQVGGGHYKNLKIQPVQYMHANNLGYCEGAIVKYISRYKNKGGIEDLKKIKHFVDLLIELEYPGESK